MTDTTVGHTAKVDEKRPAADALLFHYYHGRTGWMRDGNARDTEEMNGAIEEVAGLMALLEELVEALRQIAAWSGDGRSHAIHELSHDLLDRIARAEEGDTRG